MTDFSKRIEVLSPQKRELLKAFLEREGMSAPHQEAHVAPRTEVETLLAEIWAEVLGLERVGIHDNFLEIGGDSIQSIQIIARANEAGLSLKSDQLFEHLTISRLSEVVTLDKEPRKEP